MLKISRELELGLFLMVELARQSSGKVNKEKEKGSIFARSTNQGLIGLQKWSEKRGLPYRFLSKVAVKLKKAKLVKSKEGREGGYQLARRAKEIKVGEVFRAIEGPIAPISCLAGGKCVFFEFCGHRDLMGKLVEVIEEQLNKVSLKDLC